MIPLVSLFPTGYISSVLTSHEVAALLNVTPRRVRALKDRIGGWQKRAGVLLFPEKNVRAFMRSRKNGN